MPGQDLEWDKAVITWIRFRMGDGGYNLDKGGKGSVTELINY